MKTFTPDLNFEAFIMAQGVKLGMLAYNDNGYINQDINQIYNEYINLLDKILFDTLDTKQ